MPTFATHTTSPSSMTTQPPPRSNSDTMIFWDWDDTLLCSSYLSGEGYRLDSDKCLGDELQRQLKELAASVTTVLSLAMQHGDVHVVTNAETGWVQLSAQKFMPDVVPLLSKVNILSARSTYEGMFPESPLKWKFYAFQQRLSDMLSDQGRHKNILSFGDSHVEREAVRAATRGVPNTKTKSVKFAERPSIEQLRRQIELVTNCFQHIHNHDGDLDLALTISLTDQEHDLKKQQLEEEKQQQQYREDYMEQKQF